VPIEIGVLQTDFSVSVFLKREIFGSESERNGDRARSVRGLLLRRKERRRVGRNLDKSADEVVHIQVASQLPNAQR